MFQITKGDNNPFTFQTSRLHLHCEMKEIKDRNLYIAVMSGILNGGKFSFCKLMSSSLSTEESGHIMHILWAQNFI